MFWSPAAIGNEHLTGVACPSVSLCIGIDLEGGVVTNDPSANGSWTPATLAPGRQMQTIACPSTSLCVVTDDAGEAFTSTNPAGGAAAWSDSGSVGQNVRLLSMSCPSVSLCVDVGAAGEAVTSTNPSGGSSAWNSANIDGTSDIEGVSCPSTSLCVAVDQSGRVLTSSDPATDEWNAGQIDPLGQLSGVSCPSPQLCVAVDDHGNVLTSTNPAGGATSWSAPAEVDPNASLRSVSCLSASFCNAGDDSGRVVTTNNPAEGPQSWTVTRGLTGSNALNEMSCPSATLCVALDDSGRIATSTHPAVPQSSWHVPAQAPAPLGSFEALSCASRSFCAAITQPFNPPWCHPCAGELTTMSSTHPADGPAAWRAGPQFPGGDPFGVSCPSSKLCVGFSGNGILTTRRLHIWTSSYTIPIPPSSGPGDFFTALSCSGDRLCAATTYNGSVVSSTNTTGRHTKWKVVHVDSASPLEDVSCSSGMLCAAVDNDGSVFTSTDPTGGPRAWTPHNLHLGYPLTHIACPSISLCVALDAGGNIVWSTNPAARGSTWTVTTIDPGRTLTSLSCPSAKLCVVGDDRGNVIVGTGPGPAGISRRAALAALTRSLRFSCIHQSVRRILRRGGCATPIRAPGPGQVTITWLGPRDGLLAVGRVSEAARGNRTVHVVLTAAGRRFMRHARHGAALRIRAVFVDAAGHRYKQATRIKLRP